MININDNLQCPKCGSLNIAMVEYFDPSEKRIPFKHQYDGISEYVCEDCKYREGRWSGRELKGDDYERKFGKLDT